MSNQLGDSDSEFNEQPLLLKELIAKVQSDLIQSQREREERGDQAIFEVADLTLEVHFVLQRSGETSGGMDLKILTVGGKSQYQRQQVHKVTLRLVGVPFGASEGLSAFSDDSLPTFRPSEH